MRRKAMGMTLQLHRAWWNGPQAASQAPQMGAAWGMLWVLPLPTAREQPQGSKELLGPRPHPRSGS